LAEAEDQFGNSYNPPGRYRYDVDPVNKLRDWVVDAAMAVYYATKTYVAGKTGEVRSDLSGALGEPAVCPLDHDSCVRLRTCRTCRAAPLPW
jgi:hypothetical protein